MTRFAIVIVAVVLASSAIVPGIVLGDDPRFEAHAGQSVIVPGQSTELSVTLQNDAEDPDDVVDPAHDVHVTMLSGDTPITVTSGTRVLGTVQDGQPIRTTFAISVPQGIDPGTYHLPVEIVYEFDGDERETETIRVPVTVQDRASFEVVDRESDVPVGGDGPVTVTIENVGTESAHDATLELTSKTASLQFDGSPTAARYVGSWEPGERRTIRFSAAAAATADAGIYPLTGRIAFDDPDGNRVHSAPLPVSVSATAHSFDLRVIDSTLQVGSDGLATVEVTNSGSEDVEAVSLQVVSSGPHLHPSQVSYPLGQLEAGASTEARVPIAVDATTEPGPREITTRITYGNGDGDRVQGDTQTVVLPVSPKQSFDLEVVENTLRVDREGDLTVRVENTGDRTMQDANLRITERAPSIYPEQHEFAIDTLDPSQTTTVTFGIEVGDDATPTPRTLTFGMAYDDPDGDRRQATPQTLRMDIAPATPVFDVAVTEGTIPAGESGAMRVEITNTGEQTLRGLNAKAFTDAPVTVTDDSAFVSSLGPGETTTLQFAVAIPGDAQVKDYPLSVDVQYQDADGETKLTDTYDIPVTVEPAPSLGEQLSSLYWAFAPRQDLVLGGVAGLGVSGLVVGTIGLWRRRHDDD